MVGPPPGPSQERQRAQLRQQKLQMKKQLQAAGYAFQEEMETGEEEVWVRVIEAIRPLPTNNGGPAVDRIKRVRGCNMDRCRSLCTSKKTILYRRRGVFWSLLPISSNTNMP